MVILIINGEQVHVEPAPEDAIPLEARERAKAMAKRATEEAAQRTAERIALNERDIRTMQRD